MSGTRTAGRLLVTLSLAWASGCMGELDYDYFDYEGGSPAAARDASTQDGEADANAGATSDAGPGDDGSVVQAVDSGSSDAAGANEDAAVASPDASAPEDAGTPDADSGQVATPTALARDGWTATASVSSAADVPANAIDGDAATRFSSGTAMVGGEWLQIDLGVQRSVSRVIVDTSNSAGDYMRGYRIYVSDSADAPGSAVVEGSNDQALATIDFAAQTGRYLRIEQTGQSAEASWWSVHELTIYGI